VKHVKHVKHVLAIEPDQRQAATLRGVMGTRVRAGLVLVDSTEAAIAAIKDRVPDLILVNALFPPEEERELLAHLRFLPGATSLQLLTIPSLSAPREPERRRRTLFGAFRRRTDLRPAGCDPSAFVDQLSLYLERLSEVEPAGRAEVGEEHRESHTASSPCDRRMALRFEIQESAQALIDDRAVTLVDLSVTGAQILSPALLWRPGQLVQVVVSKEEEAIQCQAGIVWGGFEILRPTWMPYYRAGVSFKNADPRTMQKLLRGSGFSVC